MVSVKGTFAVTPRLQAPQYHAIISRILQKRFVHACVCSMVLCYITSYIIGLKHGPWYIFPWTWTGIRTIAIFSAIFPVFLVRKANLHVTPVLRNNLLTTVLIRVVSSNALRSCIAYVLSSMVITRIYLNNCASGKALGILASHKAYELPRLNERWLFMHVFGIWLGLVAAVRHAAEDKDHLVVPREKTTVPDRLQSGLLPAAREATETAVFSVITGPVIYLLLREPLFHFVLRIVKLFYRLPKSTALPGWPLNFGLLASSLLLSLLACLLWSTLNHFFNVYLSQGPVTKGRLASEKSMQADETLLSGLMNQAKHLTRLVAFEELEILSTNDEFKNRRVRIFEAGSPEATMWKGIVDAALRPITECTTNVRETLSPNQAAQPSSSGSAGTPHTLPKGASPKRSPFDKFKSEASSTAENQKQIAEVTKVTQKAEAVVANRLSAFLAPLKKYLPQDHKDSAIRHTAKTFADIRIVMLAIHSLTGFLLKSLEEDTYGRISSSFSQREHSKVSEVVLSEPSDLMASLHDAISRVGQAFEDFVDFGQYPGLASQIQSYKKSSA